MQEAIDKYYVYRFVNKDDVIVYVGSSTNMTKRFLNHMQLQDDIDRIEFIECESEAEMAWKEVYYINLFYKSTRHFPAYSHYFPKAGEARFHGRSRRLCVDF